MTVRTYSRHRTKGLLIDGVTGKYARWTGCRISHMAVAPLAADLYRLPLAESRVFRGASSRQANALARDTASPRNDWQIRSLRIGGAAEPLNGNGPMAAGRKLCGLPAASSAMLCASAIFTLAA